METVPVSEIYQKGLQNVKDIYFKMKQYSIIILLFFLTSINSFADRKGPWSKEQAWQWYKNQPWIRGCNYLSSDCVNTIDQWQEFGFEERFQTQKQELALVQSIGFNTIRLILADEGFEIWYTDHDGFMKRFERTLALCNNFGLRAIIVLGNDCSHPRQIEPRQQDSEGLSMGYTSLDDPKLAPEFFKMCREIITKYKDDKRIVFWDLWNEPGNNNRGNVTVKNLRQLFEIAWQIDPSQPLTADLWNRVDQNGQNGAEEVAAEFSDIISYHCYAPLEIQMKTAKELKEKYGRPMINTEWMARITGNKIEDCYPFFLQEGIGCTMWGFVAGKCQKYKPWENIESESGKQYDLTKWFNDLYRPSLKPYNPKEIDIIKHINQQADKEYFGQNETTRKVISEKYKILKEEMWYGYRRTVFNFKGHTAWVVEPNVAPIDGTPWTWTMQWAEAFVDRTGVLQLLEEGYHHVTIDIFNERANDSSLVILAEFQHFLCTECGFAPKSNLIGMSWGGFFSVRYAAANPQNVAKIYLDAPLLVFGNRSFKGDIGPWAKLKSPKSNWSKVDAMPVNMANQIAKAKIPVLLLYGGQDQTVNPSENCELFAQRFQEAGGKIEIVKRGGFGHHPHGEDPNKTSVITSFIKK